MRRMVRPLTVVIGLLLVAGAVAGTVAGNPAAGHRRVAAGAPGSTASAAQTQTQTQTVAPPTGPAATPTAPVPSAVTTGVPPTTAAQTRPAMTAAPTPLAKLTAALDAALAGTASCLSVEDSGGHPLYQRQPDLALVPASTQKLLVAAAALTTLGPNFRFVTNVVAPAAPAGAQVSQLWLVGNGDPLLATAEFTATLTGRARVAGYPWTPLPALADAVAAAGVASVPGGIHGDDSHLDQLRFLPVWPAAYQTQQQIGLLSALSLNEGIQTTAPKLTLAQDPPGFAASELGRLLAARHVSVGPPVADQTAPAGGVVVASVPSVPLVQIIEVMLRASDNWIAELLVRQMDRAAGGSGTTAGGVAVVLREAAALGIPLTGVHMDDGSGLSRTNRATCRELLATLDLSTQARFSAIMDGLPVAAATGTLAARYGNTPLAGRLRAKTGSIDNAGGMVGVVTVGAPVRFSLLVNQIQVDSGLFAKEDAVVAALAAYPG